MKSAVSKLQENNLLRMEKTKFELALDSGGIFRNILSKVYDILVRNEETADVSQMRWEKDIEGAILQKEWNRTHRFIRVISLNTAIREKKIKV